MACSSTAGFHQRSKWMTWSAAGQVEPGAAGLERKQEDRRLARLEPLHHRLALAHRRAAVQELVGDAGLRQVRLEQPGHRDVLGEDQGGAVLGEHGAEQLVDQVELLGAAGEPDHARLLQEVGRVVADLLEPGEQRQHQAAPGDLVVVAGALDAGHRVADERLVEHHLLAGQAAAGGRSRSWPAARARCRGRTCGGAAGTARSGRRTAGSSPRARPPRSARPRPGGTPAGCRAAPGSPSRGSTTAR